MKAAIDWRQGRKRYLAVAATSLALLVGATGVASADPPDPPGHERNEHGKGHERNEHKKGHERNEHKKGHERGDDRGERGGE